MPQQLAESQPPWQAGTRQCPAQAVQAEQQEGAEHQRGDQAAAEQGEGQLQVETQPPHDQAQGEQGAGVGHPGAHRHRQQVVAQDPQRRYPAQGRQRRQGEAGQCYQAGGDPGEGGEQAAGWYVRRQQRGEQAEQAELRQPAEQGADGAGEQAQQQQLQRVEEQGFAARQTEAAQQRAGVVAPCGETGGGQRHGDAGEQHRGQAGQVQVALGTAEGIAHLAVAVAGILQALVGGEAALDLLAIGLEGFRRAFPQIAVAHRLPGWTTPVASRSARLIMARGVRL